MQTLTSDLLAMRDINDTFAIHTQAVEHAIQVMHTHMQELLTLEDLASVACLSPYYFNRIFRRIVGIPPGEFLSALRFQKARSLLLTTPLSVIDVCFEVGYTSTGSFTSRFTQLVGLSPRHLRQRAHEFELSPQEHSEWGAANPVVQQGMHNMLLGQVNAPENFRGAIYIGLFSKPIPQAVPIRCTMINTPGLYLINDIPDGIYHLLAAAFPIAPNLQSYFLPGKDFLVGKGARPLIIRNGRIYGDPDFTLRPPLLTDPPLVMALPLV